MLGEQEGLLIDLYSRNVVNSLSRATEYCGDPAAPALQGSTRTWLEVVAGLLLFPLHWLALLSS